LKITKEKKRERGDRMIFPAQINLLHENNSEYNRTLVLLVYPSRSKIKIKIKNMQKGAITKYNQKF
jgi:hypothetical protein